MSKLCQSCGMPMKQDPAGGGTNADGSKNTEYCSLCYEGGQFTQPDFTVEEMQQFCVGKITESGVPRFVAQIYSRSIPKLKRWSARH